MVNLHNVVTRLWIIVFSLPYGVYYQSDSLGLLRWNPHLTPLRPKILPTCHILMVVTELHFGAVRIKFSSNAITTKKMPNLENVVTRVWIIFLSYNPGQNVWETLRFRWRKCNSSWPTPLKNVGCYKSNTFYISCTLYRPQLCLGGGGGGKILLRPCLWVCIAG